MQQRVARLLERVKNNVTHSLGLDFSNPKQMAVVEKLAGNILLILAEQAELIAADMNRPTSVAAKTLNEFSALCALTGAAWADEKVLAEAEATPLVDTGVVAAAVLPDGWLGGK